MPSRVEKSPVRNLRPKQVRSPSPGTSTSSGIQKPVGTDGYDSSQPAETAKPPQTDLHVTASQQLVLDTQDLRSMADQVRALSDRVSKTDPSDPSYAQRVQQLATADRLLQQKYGYDHSSLPAPGTMWVAPEFQSKDLPADQVTSSHFATSAPVRSPPSAYDALFKDGQPYRLVDEHDQTISLDDPSAYRAYIAAYRSRNGFAPLHGAPVAVQASFQGGSGLGRRYGAALEEMGKLGIVPTSVAGTSVGAIAASVIAAGADPAEVRRFLTDPNTGHVLDVGFPGGGLFPGKVAYDLIDQELRRVTGITSRPVTFADLKIPLQIVACKMSDTAPDPGTDDLTQAKNRTFVFSQETTPNTPVAVAVRASFAIPGIFDPVYAVDPMTGRTIALVDGGTLDPLPMKESPPFGLPTVGVSLLLPDTDNPADYQAQAKPLPAGNLDVGNPLRSYLYARQMSAAAAGPEDDFRDRTDPKANQYMLSLPSWDLDDTSKRDAPWKFSYDATDALLDPQTRAVTRKFLGPVLPRMLRRGNLATNVTTQIPTPLSFSIDVTIKGQPYTAKYEGGDEIAFVARGSGKGFDAKLGQKRIEAIYLDGQAFGDFAAQLAFWGAKSQK